MRLLLRLLLLLLTAAAADKSASKRRVRSDLHLLAAAAATAPEIGGGRRRSRVFEIVEQVVQLAVPLGLSERRAGLQGRHGLRGGPSKCARRGQVLPNGRALTHLH
jgi:hypothetical protein